MTRALVSCAAAVALVVVSGCDIADEGDNLLAGKQAFIQKCGSCHILNRAATKGVSGPNLDEAFQQARKDGFGESTFRGIIYQQILYPARSAQIDPATGKPGAAMPAGLAKGEEAKDIAAYVATAAGKPGEDEDRGLAAISAEKKAAKTEAKDGKLELPADAGGLLAYEFTEATAQAGPLEIDMPNPSSIDHNVAIEGGGQNEIGPVVGANGNSVINVDVQPGEYTLYCSVPGHREGGMEAKLVVE